MLTVYFIFVFIINVDKFYQEEAEEDEGPPDEVRLWEDGFKDRSAYTVSFPMRWYIYEYAKGVSKIRLLY
jgi:hypothetical protein